MATTKKEFASGIGHEIMAFACVFVLLYGLAMRQDPEASLSESSSAQARQRKARLLEHWHGWPVPTLSWARA